MDFTYKEMLEMAIANGTASEDKMWKSVDNISVFLEELKASHPQMYWNFMRKQYGLMNDRHYGEMYAKYDVSTLRYTDREGVKHEGAHWTMTEIENATEDMEFHDCITKWDKYVAFNAAYADFCKVLSDDDILKVGYSFFFADEDWNTRSKVWDYFCFKSN